MLEYFVYINGVVWFSVGIILMIGNLTYADYYTKLDKTTMNSFWVCYGAVSCIGFMNFLISAVANLLIIDSGRSALLYGLGWIAGCSVLMYVGFAIFGIVVGFTKLKKYFGRKRNKI